MAEIKQLFDEETSTYTYFLLDEYTKKAVIVDPVKRHVQRDLKALADWGGYTLALILDTHIHADHITGAGLLKKETGADYGLGKELEGVDVVLQDNQILYVGAIIIAALHTPGHTAESFCFAVDDVVLTGDTLLIGKVGRTDFQGGDPGQLYDSIQSKLFTLLDSTVVFPGHDYSGKSHSHMGEEKEGNIRIGGGKTREEFIEIMNNLNLDRPKRMDVAVPANLKLGLE